MRRAAERNHSNGSTPQMTEYQRPPIVTQLTLPEIDGLEALLSSVDGAAAAWAYQLTATDGRSRRDAHELLGAAMDALVRARHAYEKGITRDG